MKSLLLKIRQISPLLFYCGMAHLGLFILLTILSQIDHRQLFGIDIWIKPGKFALSIAIYSLSWPLILQFLPFEHIKNKYTNFTVFTLYFEMLAIASQAARGQASHFNVNGTYNTVVFTLMGVFIVSQTLFTLYIGFLFFKTTAIQIPASMLWGIRLGIIITCIFAFEGGLMAHNLSHTVGANDGTKGIPFFNWSRMAGDLRIAHFAGMHALQIIPLFAQFISPGNKRITISFASLYFLMVSALFYNAMLGRPLC
jgi:hypothetical protein